MRNCLLLILSQTAESIVLLVIVQAVPEHVKYTFKTKHPASVMMFGLISSDGLKMLLVFIKSGQ